jgi:hypothetical protein
MTIWSAQAIHIKAIVGGSIRAGLEIRKNHRTEVTVGTEASGPGFSGRSSVFGV